MSDFTPVTAIVRAYPEQKRRARRTEKQTVPFEPYDVLLVLDTETATDDTLTMPGFEDQRWDGIRQPLLFGRLLVMQHTGNREYEAVREIVFYPDDLPGEGIERLRGALLSEPDTELMPHREFLAEFYKLAVKTTRQKERVATVGFNLAFDLSRIALKASTSRRTSGRFTFQLWDYTDRATGRKRRNTFRPNLTIEDAGDFKFYAWTNIRAINGETGQRYTVCFQDNFIDCQTMMRALFNEIPSLDGALAYMAKKTGEPVEQKDEIEQHGIITPEYVAYNRRDVALTAKLAVWLLKEAAQHPISDPAKLYSTASLSKAYMRAMGIDSPPALRCEGIPETVEQVTGYLMSTYFGARTEVALRNAKVPVVYLDFLSMYPTVIINSGIWDFMRAGQITVRDDTANVRQWLERLAVDDLFSPATWQEMNVIVQVTPDSDILPVRATFGGDSTNIGFPYVTSERALWYTLHDVIASKILTGKVPLIQRAIRFAPGDPRKSMEPVTLFSAAEIDPYRDNLFKVAIEERKQVKDGTGRYADLPKAVRDATQQTLKILANSTYGYYVELNEKTIAAQEYKLYSVDESSTVQDWTEAAGPYFSPAIATFITAGARLMLALLERLVYDADGQHVFCDTDSMAIVALPERQTVALTSTGADGEPVDTPITALSWGEVDAIIQRFESLNPYDKGKAPDTVLKVEDVNFEGEDIQQPRRQLYAYAVSSKRHCLFDQHGQPVKVTLSAMGGVINPDPHKYVRRTETSESFVEQRAKDLWTAFLRDGHIDNVPYIDAPMVRQRAISTPATLHYFKQFNRGKTYSGQIKPHSFFLEASILIGPISAAKECVAFRSFEPNPDEWLNDRWMLRDSGEDVAILALPYLPGNQQPTREYMESVYRLNSTREAWARVTTFRTFFSKYLVHPEVKFQGIDGEPCGQQTTGLLERRHVRIIDVALTGKEGKAAKRNNERLRPIIADYANETVRLNDGILNNPPVTEAQLHGIVRSVLLDIPRAQLERALRLNRATINRHLKAERFPRQYRDGYHNAAIDYAERQTGERDLAALWMYALWRGVWQSVRPILDTVSDAPILIRAGRKSRTVNDWLSGRRTPDVKTARFILRTLEPAYRERLSQPGAQVVRINGTMQVQHAYQHPGLRQWPFAPLAQSLHGLAFWQTVISAFYWMSPDGCARIAAHHEALRRVLSGEVELSEGIEYAETKTPDGWQWGIQLPDFESAEHIVSAKTDFFYRIHTMGRGPLDQRHIEETRREARAILAADGELTENTTLEDSERALLVKLASDNDETVRRAIDSIRDRRLRGRITPRSKNRKGRAPYRADRFISAAGEEATERLREARRKGGRR